MDVTVCVGTFGDLEWVQTAQRAIASIPDDTARVHVHSDTLARARNLALTEVDTEWVCFLDADDELEPGYMDAMGRAHGSLRAPAVRYVRNGIVQHARMPRVAGHQHDCTVDCLRFGNWLVIGSVVKSDIVRQVGGFREFAWSEDWDLWVRCVQHGAVVNAVPDAVYRAHVRPDSRNRAPERDFKHAVHQDIARANGLPVPA